MKLKTTIEPDYKNGDSKSRLPFAWLPKRIGDVYVWLGRYEVLYVYVIEEIVGEVKGQQLKFNVGKWVKVSDRTI